MGLHPNASVFVHRDGKNLRESEVEADVVFCTEVVMAIEKQSGYEDEDDGTYFRVEDCNWHDVEYDLAEVSKLYPGITLEAELFDGDTEQALITARDGKVHARWGEVVFPDFDEAQMKAIELPSWRRPRAA